MVTGNHSRDDCIAFIEQLLNDAEEDATQDYIVSRPKATHKYIHAQQTHLLFLPILSKDNLNKVKTHIETNTYSNEFIQELVKNATELIKMVGGLKPITELTPFIGDLKEWLTYMKNTHGNIMSPSQAGIAATSTQTEEAESEGKSEESFIPFSIKFKNAKEELKLNFSTLYSRKYKNDKAFWVELATNLTTLNMIEDTRVRSSF